MDQHYESSSDDDGEEIINKIKKIKVEEFLHFKETREILEINHLDTFFENCEKDINKLYDKIKECCDQQMSSALRFDIPGKGKGKIAGLVYKYINKEYNLEFFEEYPELTTNLIAKLEEKNNKKF